MAGAALLAPRVQAAEAREIEWDDLIPPGTPYGQIVGPGQIDEVNDIWLPQFDDNALQLNQALDGQRIRMPGFVVPLEFDASSTTVFLLVPYMGACIHVPPPPPNQLVLVTTDTGWQADTMWEAVWVSGILRTQMGSTEIAETGYALHADRIERYEDL